MKYFLMASLLAALFSCGDPYGNKNVKNLPKDSIEGYEYSYSGTMMWYITWYKIEKGEDGSLKLLYSKDCEPEITIYKCPQDALEKIDGIVREYTLWKLKSSYYPKLDVLDGYGWHTYVKYKDGSLSTGGSNAWPPKELNAGISAINSYIQGIIGSASEDDILGTTMHE